MGLNSSECLCVFYVFSVVTPIACLLCYFWYFSLFCLFVDELLVVCLWMSVSVMFRVCILCSIECLQGLLGVLGSVYVLCACDSVYN